MGTISDIIGMIDKLNTKITDRKLASELAAIQSLVLQLQSEQAALHEKNMELREENVTLKEGARELKAQIEKLNSSPTAGPKGVPPCPNCSKPDAPFYMSPIPSVAKRMTGGKWTCSQCNYVGS